MGNYYNFYAATAGSGTSTFVGEAPDSICPKGWRMVGIDWEKEEKSWINLFSEYYGGTKTGDNLSNGDTIVIVSSFNFLRFGRCYWNSGVLGDRTRDGYYWSIKAYSAPYAHALNSGHAWLYYQNSYGKGYGQSLRCVAMLFLIWATTITSMPLLLDLVLAPLPAKLLILYAQKDGEW